MVFLRFYRILARFRPFARAPLLPLVTEMGKGADRLRIADEGRIEEEDDEKEMRFLSISASFSGNTDSLDRTTKLPHCIFWPLPRFFPDDCFLGANRLPGHVTRLSGFYAQRRYFNSAWPDFIL